MSSIYPGAEPNSAADAGRSPSDQVSDASGKLGEAASGLHAEVAQFAERAGGQLADQAKEKQDAVSDALGVFADAIRKASEDLSGQEQTFAAKIAGQAADGLETFSRNLAAKSPEEMLQVARDLGRDNPAALFAGAVVAGVALGRFARSSAHHQDSGDQPKDQRLSAGSELNFSPPLATEPDHG